MNNSRWMLCVGLCIRTILTEQWPRSEPLHFKTFLTATRGDECLALAVFWILTESLLKPYWPPSTLCSGVIWSRCGAGCGPPCNSPCHTAATTVTCTQGTHQALHLTHIVHVRPATPADFQHLGSRVFPKAPIDNFHLFLLISFINWLFYYCVINRQLYFFSLECQKIYLQAGRGKYISRNIPFHF